MSVRSQTAHRLTLEPGHRVQLIKDKGSYFMRSLMTYYVLVLALYWWLLFYYFLFLLVVGRLSWYPRVLI